MPPWGTLEGGLAGLLGAPACAGFVCAEWWISTIAAAATTNATPIPSAGAMNAPRREGLGGTGSRPARPLSSRARRSSKGAGVTTPGPGLSGRAVRPDRRSFGDLLNLLKTVGREHRGKTPSGSVQADVGSTAGHAEDPCQLGRLEALPGDQHRAVRGHGQGAARALSGPGPRGRADRRVGEGRRPRRAAPCPRSARAVPSPGARYGGGWRPRCGRYPAATEADRQEPHRAGAIRPGTRRRPPRRLPPPSRPVATPYALTLPACSRYSRSNVSCAFTATQDVRHPPADYNQTPRQRISVCDGRACQAGGSQRGGRTAVTSRCAAGDADLLCSDEGGREIAAASQRLLPPEWYRNDD